MLQVNTARAMINQLLQSSQCTLSVLAHHLGVHEQTLHKLQLMDDFQLLPAKQLALIKLYCAKRTR